MAGSQIIECIAIDVDSKDRQLLLEQFANNPSKRSFELKEVKDENGVILDVEIKIDDYVVGKLSPKDLDLYRNNFYNSSKVNIFNQNLWFNQVSQLEETMNKYLENCKNFEVVNDVRVLGGIGVVELKTHVNMLLLQEFFVSHGVWIRPFNNLIYLMPPYISPEEDIIKLCNVIELALKNGKYR